MGIDAKILVRVPRAVGEEEVRSIGHKLCALFGHDRFFVYDRGDGRRRHVIFPVDEYEQDGDPITPEPGETLLEVSLWTRYYGEGYERGDVVFICALVEGLERLIPGAAVWYGGDSSGVLAEPFGKEQRAALLDHFFHVDHHPYIGYFSRVQQDQGANPICMLCEMPMDQCGFGATFALFRCVCGEQVEIQGGVEERTTARERSDRNHARQTAVYFRLMEEQPALYKELINIKDNS
jgi:hypothetical protein